MEADIGKLGSDAQFGRGVMRDTAEEWGAKFRLEGGKVETGAAKAGGAFDQFTRSAAGAFIALERRYLLAAREMDSIAGRVSNLEGQAKNRR